MPRPTLRDVHVNRPLTNVSIAYRNDEYIGAEVFPIVPVQKKSDLYFVFNKSQWFRLRSGPRPPGREAPVADYSVSTASYICLNDALSYKIADEVRANADQPLRPDVTGTEFVTDGLLLALENRVATLVTASGNWASASNPTTKWDVDTSDVWGDIDTAVNAVKDNIGRKPNVMVFSETAWRNLRNHPDLIDRVKYQRVGGKIEPADLMGWFNIDKILIGGALKDTSQEGAAAALSQIWGDMMWTGYVTPNAALEQPTAGYVFQWGNRTVQRFRMERHHSDIVAAEWFTSEVIVASDAGAIMSDVTT